MGKVNIKKDKKYKKLPQPIQFLSRGSRYKKKKKGRSTGRLGKKKRITVGLAHEHADDQFSQSRFNQVSRTSVTRDTYVYIRICAYYRICYRDLTAQLWKLIRQYLQMAVVFVSYAGGQQERDEGCKVRESLDKLEATG